MNSFVLENKKWGNWDFFLKAARFLDVLGGIIIGKRCYFMATFKEMPLTQHLMHNIVEQERPLIQP